MSDRDGNTFVWFLAGLGIGAVVGVLYAPRPGEETRDVLLSKAQEGKERVRSQARKAREQAEDWMDRGRDVVKGGGSLERAGHRRDRKTLLNLGLVVITLIRVHVRRSEQHGTCKD